MQELIRSDRPEPAAVRRRFDTWKYKRAHPSSLADVDQVIGVSLKWGSPIAMVGYWGAGERSELRDVDRMAMERLCDIGSEVKSAWEPGLVVTLVLTDVHADLNGLESRSTNRYLDSIQELAGSFGIATVRLSQLRLWQGIPPFEPVSEDEISLGDLEPELVCSLQEMASRHFHGDPQLGMKRYYACCIRENSAIERIFANAVQFTYNHPRFGKLLPALPTVFLHSTKKGTSEKPWFLAANR